AEMGIERFIINTSHLHEAFEVAFPDHEWNGIALEFVHEPERLETGTGLKNIEPLLDPNEPLLIYNSDVLTDLPLDELIRGHHEMGRPLVTLASSLAGNDLHLLTDGGNRLLKVDRSADAPPGFRYQFLGISIIEPGFLNFLQKETPESLIHGWARALEADPDSVRTWEISQGRWQDIGTLSAYESIRDSGLNHHSLSLNKPSGTADRDS
ncbi:MAG: nucleotidyltransferase family protein, partial [Puniceicoccales bacterium]